MSTISLELLVQIATIGSVLLTAATFAYAICTYKRQMEVQMLQVYTARHDEVTQSLRRASGAVHFDVFRNPPPETAELRLEVLRYLNLCSEEFYLNERGYLSRHVWDIWRREIEEKVATALVRREWIALSEEFKSQSQFRAYVSQIHAR